MAYIPMVKDPSTSDATFHPNMTTTFLTKDTNGRNLIHKWAIEGDYTSILNANDQHPSEFSLAIDPSERHSMDGNRWHMVPDLLLHGMTAILPLFLQNLRFVIKEFSVREDFSPSFMLLNQIWNEALQGKPQRFFTDSIILNLGTIIQQTDGLDRPTYGGTLIPWQFIAASIGQHVPVDQQSRLLERLTEQNVPREELYTYLSKDRAVKSEFQVDICPETTPFFKPSNRVTRRVTPINPALLYFEHIFQMTQTDRAAVAHEHGQILRFITHGFKQFINTLRLSYPRIATHILSKIESHGHLKISFDSKPTEVHWSPPTLEFHTGHLQRLFQERPHNFLLRRVATTWSHEFVHLYHALQNQSGNYTVDSEFQRLHTLVNRNPRLRTLFPDYAMQNHYEFAAVVYGEMVFSGHSIETPRLDRLLIVDPLAWSQREHQSFTPDELAILARIRSGIDLFRV